MSQGISAEHDITNALQKAGPAPSGVVKGGRWAKRWVWVPDEPALRMVPSAPMTDGWANLAIRSSSPAAGSDRDYLPMEDIQENDFGLPQPMVATINSESEYDEAYVQLLAAPYQHIAYARFQEPSDLHGIISDLELRQIRQIASGRLYDVFSLEHLLLGDIVLKRVKEVGDEAQISRERLVCKSVLLTST